MKAKNLHQNKINIIKSILLIALIVIPILNTQAQNKPDIFYYAYDKKIELSPLKNKAVVKFHQDMSFEAAKSSIQSSIQNPIAFTLEHIDNRTFFILSDYADNFIERLRQNPIVHTVSPEYVTSEGGELGIADQILIKFRPEVSRSSIDNLNNSYGVTVVKTTDSYVLITVPDKADALTIANAYQESGLVIFSHPDFIITMEKSSYIPNDPFFNNQFGLNNTGQVINSIEMHTGTPDADVDAPEAWDITKGCSDIIIAVIDEGVTANHPDLPNSRQVRLNGSNFAAPRDATNPNDPSPPPTGNKNHGNACAGIIGASQDNGEGITGICPNCKIMPVRIPIDLPGLVSDYVGAIDFARNNGADILSNSWNAGTTNPNAFPAIVTAIQNASTFGRGGKGSVVVFSAGNTARHNIGDPGVVIFPGNVMVPNVITVGASDRYDLQADYSPSSNPGSNQNQIIDIVAPSHRAYSCSIASETKEVWTMDIPGASGYNPWPENGDCGLTGGGIIPPLGELLPASGTNYLAYTGRMGGTSAAAPLVAGVAGLVLTMNSTLTAQQVFDRLTSTADKVGGYNYTGGVSIELGAGRVNAHKAVLPDAGVDLYMKDCPADNGTEPTTCSSVYFSDDIWCQNLNVGFTNLHAHQNPNASGTFVYVAVRNRGTRTSLGIEQLNVHWAKADLSQSWPISWNGSTTFSSLGYTSCTSPDPLVGNIIPTPNGNVRVKIGNNIGSAVSSINGSITIPALNPNEVAYFEIPWMPPNPSDYNCLGSNVNVGHYCLLARIDACNDPMRSPETTDTYGNAANNNNIVWKNIDVFDNIPGKKEGFVMGNFSSGQQIKKIQFKSDSAIALLNKAIVKTKLSSGLYQIWAAGGKQGNGITELSDSSIQMVSPGAFISNLTLGPNKHYSLSLEIALRSSPLDSLPLKQEYKLDVEQTDVTQNKIDGGIRFLYRPLSKFLNLSVLVEGFWNGTKMAKDVAGVYLRNTSSPYAIRDSATANLDSLGKGSFTFSNSPAGSYYVVVKHRNSIETWSSTALSFTLGNITSYDFTTAANKAFGSNMLLKGGRYCIFSGDVDQNGNVDGQDLSIIDNDAFNFVTGYKNSDVTGNNVTDASDLAIADNNAFNFVSTVHP